MDADENKKKSDKIKEESLLPGIEHLQKKFEILIDAFERSTTAEKKWQKIMLPATNGFSIHLIDELIYCNSADHYVVCYFTDKSEPVVCMALKEVEALLPAADFMRIHNSILVNLNKISQYIKGDGGIVIMSDGKELNVARSHKEQLLIRLKENTCKPR